MVSSSSFLPFELHMKIKKNTRKMKINIQENFTETVNKQNHITYGKREPIFNLYYRSRTYIFRNLLRRSVFHR